MCMIMCMCVHVGVHVHVRMCVRARVRVGPKGAYFKKYWTTSQIPRIYELLNYHYYY